MDKITIISKSYDGNEWLKSLAQKGTPQINQQIISPWDLYKESLLTHGVEMKALPFETPVGVFLMLRILKKNPGGYFYGASYKDAEIAYQAIQALRNQCVGTLDQEVEEISNLILPGVLAKKSNGIINELLIPYLTELKDLNLWDRAALYHDFMENSNNGKVRKGKIQLIDEDPLSPLEMAFINGLGAEGGIEILARDDLFFPKSFEEEGEKEIFKAYGSFNEWREVLETIIQSNEPYDQFVIASPQEDRIAHFMKEQNFVPYSLAKGFQRTHIDMEIGIEKRKEQALKAGFGENDLNGLEKEIYDSLADNKVGSEKSQSGKIHLTDIRSLPLIQRKNVFIMGVEAYTGSQMENPILLDGDILELRKKSPKSDLRTSVEKTRLAIQDFHWGIDYLVKENRNVTISYSYYDTASLKAQAKPSIISPLEGLFKEGQDSGYFADNRAPLTLAEATAFLYYIGKGFNASSADKTEGGGGLGEIEALRISATAAENLIECPYKFALERLLNMEVSDHTLDITSWLDPREMGSLCHEIFERYHKETKADNTIEEDKILINGIYKIVTDYWLKDKPPKVNPERELKEIMTLVEKYVVLKNRIGKNKVIFVEKSFESMELIANKLLVHGTADLVEENTKGLTVTDVKTGRRIKQINQNVKSCIQAVLYCCLLEDENHSVPIHCGYYLYPRSNRVISCDYNKKAKDQAVELLKEALSSIETGDGWKIKDQEICKYCSIKEICEAESKGRFFQKLIEEGVIS